MSSEDYQIILDLINNNLAGNPKILPEKHREVEIALLNAIKNISNGSMLTLAKGSYYLEDVKTDTKITILMPNVGTLEYMVLGSLRGHQVDGNKDNDVFWTWHNPQLTSFDVWVREITNNYQYLTFYYVVIPL